MIELTSDPLSEAARQGCATLCELAGRTQAIIVLDRYLGMSATRRCTPEHCVTKALHSSWTRAGNAT